MKSMKVLIAYDGTECSRDMLVDLAQAGLPETLQADVIAFADVLPPGHTEAEWEMEEMPDADGLLSDPVAATAIEHAVASAREGRERVQKLFPNWIVTSQSYATMAADGVPACVREWSPNLVVVGSHNRSAPGRFLHGSLGETLLAESPCSVRIARAPYGEQPGGLRVLVAVDGSTESTAAVRTVASRHWPAGTSIRVVAAYDHGPLDTEVGIVVGPSAVGFDYDDIEDVEVYAAAAAAILREAGLEARSIVSRGRPASIILAAAEQWASDMIFMGARGHRFLERILIGSVSHAVATRAHCSVEVIREHR